MIADTLDTANEVLGMLRLNLADQLGIERKGFSALWVVDFPMFKWDEENERYAANHHPFTMPPSPTSSIWRSGRWMSARTATTSC